MARVRMVTRTVNEVKCLTLCVDVITQTTDMHVFSVGGGITDDKELLKAICKQHETDTFKPVAIVSKLLEQTLYGMPESEFIRLAEILPPRTVALETETE